MLQAYRDVVSLAGFVSFAAPGQQVGAGGPVGLIVGEPRVR